MRHISMVLIALILTLSTGASGQTPNSNGRKPAPKALVRKLPSGTEGVQLKGNSVRAKPGYKFVKQPNGTVTVARISGGGREEPMQLAPGIATVKARPAPVQ